MKKSMRLLALVIPVSLTACQGFDATSLIDMGMQGAQIAAISDNDVRTLSVKSCAEMDSKSSVANSSSKYSQRLNNIAKRLGTSVNGVNLDYKVYVDDSVNAWAMANGCIRVYTGLMDLMTDNEIEGVLSHEIGHVALGHSKKAMQVAYGSALARQSIAAATSEAIAALTRSQLGDLAQQLVTSQFSQTQELASDNFAYDHLKSKKLATQGLLTAFEKLNSLGNSQASILSTHPSSAKRADNIRNRIKNDSK